jgi:hypothetical protein
MRQWNIKTIALVGAGTAIVASFALISFRYPLLRYDLHSDKVSVPIGLHISEIGEEATVSQWWLIGPFSLVPGDQTTDQDGLKRDYLLNIGYPQTSLAEDSIPSLCKGRHICRSYSGQGSVIPLFHLFPTSPRSVVYAFATITCEHDIDVVLEVGVNEGVFAWLNSYPILSVPIGDKGGTAIKYHHLAVAHFRQGKNLLIIKTDSGNDARTWTLIASFMSMKSARDKYIELANGYILKTRFIKPGESLVLVKPELSDDLSARIKISDWRGAAVMSKVYESGHTIYISTKHLPNGYYTVTMQVGNGIVRDEFYLGDTDPLYRALCREQLKSKPTDQEYIQRDPMIQRYHILTSPQYYHPLDADWQRKLLLVVKDAILEEHFRQRASWTQLPGMHLREYISQIDGTPQNYLIYVPDSVRGPFPLVIDMPYAQQTERPFLESSLPIGWPQALDDLKRAADQAGFAVAVINGRGNVGDAPIGEADTFEALKDVLSGYNIDVLRIYLFGTCEGGRRALALAKHYPGVFAAVGVYGPALNSDMMSRMDGLAKTPVSILQGEYDDVPPRGILNTFFVKLKQLSPSSELNIYPDGVHGTSASEARLFPWLSLHTNDSVSPPIQKTISESLSKVNAGSVDPDTADIGRSAHPQPKE